MAEEPLKRTETIPIRHSGQEGFVYPSGYYVPEPYQTFHIPTQGPLEHTRKSISHGFGAFANAFVHPYGEGQFKHPKADIRESKTAYYIDVAIPGLESKTHVVLKWTNASTLFVEAQVQPAELAEKDVVVVVKERKTGTFARAFQFPVQVEQDATKARLGYGVLRITVPKKGSAVQDHKVVEVEHEGH